MIRTPLPRSQPKRLSPSEITEKLAQLRAMQRRQKALPKRRSKPRRQSNKCPELLAWLRTQPCCLSGLRTGDLRWFPDGYWTVVVEAAHFPHVRRLGGDLNNALPFANYLHRSQHVQGIETFAQEHGHTVESLQTLATEYTTRFLAEHPGIAAGLLSRWNDTHRETPSGD